MGLLQSTYNDIIFCYLKHCIWPSADVKPMSNYLVHAMTECLISLRVHHVLYNGALRLQVIAGPPQCA